MKNMKKMFAILIAVLMLGSLTCTAWADKADEVTFDNLESYRMDLEVSIDMDMSMMGETMSGMKMDMTGTMDVTMDPQRSYIDLITTSEGEEQHSLTFCEFEDSKYVVYTSLDEGETWDKQTLDVELAPNAMASSAESLEKIAEFAKDFEKTGTDEIHGRKADIYSGVLSGEQLGEYLAISGALDSVFNAFGMSLGDMDSSMLGEMPIAVALDTETGMVLGYGMDMTDMMQNLMQAMIEAIVSASLEGQELPEGFDLSALGISIDINEATSYTTLYDFNEVEEIQMPEAA